MSDWLPRAPPPHGMPAYVECSRCHVVRPVVAMTDGRCTDAAWCSRESGVGLGHLDVPKERA